MDIITNMKICTKCKENKNILEFEHGRNQCKKCRNKKQLEYQRKYKTLHKEKIKESWTLSNKKRKDKVHTYYKNNKDKIKCDDIICMNCKLPSKGWKNRNSKFCSNKCRSEYHSKNISGCNNPNYHNGISYEPYCPKWNENLRKRVRAYFDNRCIICGKHEKDNKFKSGKCIKLSVHHVEYNKAACCDGKPVHFAALCHRHHLMTNSNREQWENILHKR